MDLIVTTLVCGVTLVFGCIILLQDSKKTYARLFMALCLMIIAWSAANYLTNLATLDQTTLNLTNKLSFAGGFIVVYMGLLFSYRFPRPRLAGRAEKSLVVLLGIAGVSVSFFEDVVGRAISTVNGVEFTAGQGIFIYLAIFIVVLLLIIRNLTTNLGSKSRLEKSQSRLILGGFIASAVLGLCANIIIPLLTAQWHTTTYGPLAVLVLVLTISYAIVRHGLFDIRLAVVRSVAYGLSLAVLAAIYYGLAYVVSLVLFQGQTSSTIGISPINIALALVLAFLFQSIKHFFDRLTDRVFFRDRYSTDEFYAALSKILAGGTNLHDLLSDASHQIASSLRARHAGFYIRYGDQRHIMSGTLHHARLPALDAASFDKYCKQRASEVFYADDPDMNKGLKRLMKSHDIEVALPLRHGEDIAGYLLLGPHLASGYTSRDIRVLETVKNELVIAIENASSVQKVREINANLEQRIDAATGELRTSNARLKRLDAAKDEFISMASHQLRTPLTSVKGYLSMVLEGDVGRVTKMQRQVLEEAFASSERMVHLIHDFLNVSRLQTGKFALEPSRVDLSRLVQEEVKSLERTAASRGLTLRLSDDLGTSEMTLDDTKIRQVVMNYIDNAIFYSHAGTTIRITLKKQADYVVFTVEDSGIGVPKKEQAQLFEKFFRASNARRERPDGTGVGIFLAKKIIDAHGGAVIFSSVEGKGSTFGFRLPLSLQYDPDQLDDHPKQKGSDRHGD